tara:strand:+ start:242 stop:634 length:393 start_codon:yes stop_codon:yes gene_type:complete
MELPTLRNASSICSERLIEELDDHLIRLKVGELSAPEVAGGYRAICAKLLAETLTVMKKRPIKTKREVLDRKRTRLWMNSNEGVVTFREVCETLNLNPTTTREAIYLYAERPENSPISKSVIGALNYDAD